MQKTLIALAAATALFAAGAVSAQVGKAASEATDAVQHKIDEKRADSKARKSGPVGKAVNNVKSSYHKNRSSSSAQKAKRSLKNAG
jgi:rhamnogalacturonyl hydrolase YesR